MSSMTADSPSTEWWKFTSTGLLGGIGVLTGIVLTLITIYFGGDFVTEADLSRRLEAVEVHTSENINLNRESIARNRETVQKLTEKIGELVKSQAELTGELRQLTRQLQQQR